MINKGEVIEFFNEHASGWDADMEISDRKVGIIMDNAGVKKGSKVLDVACGTGVLVPYYLERNAASVLGVDISPKMIEIARTKFKEENVSFLVGDVEEADIDKDFDAIVIYNAFPHFSDGERLIKCLSKHLKKGGRLTVAHGSSREEIDAHHFRAAKHVSNGLQKAEDLAEIFSKYLKVTTVLSNDEMYQIVGEK
ncbi:MAG: class I SAM-dependent methyltransferase [Lachnospiraceae bacterium]|nr:class I SAM-dependent methyltransferase [Lachnospiraceae bacterium]